MKNGDDDCLSMAITSRVDNFNDNIYAPYKNWCLKPKCVSVMDVNTPEEQKDIITSGWKIINPPYHQHICMYSFACWLD